MATLVPKPLLIYDGECGFCRYCVDYARALTGERVDYETYQLAAGQYPKIPLVEFRDAIQLLDGEERCSGAEASFRLLAIGGRPGLLWLYLRLGLFAWLSEALYQWVTRHRPLCHRLARLSWGSPWQPLDYERSTWLFMRGLALVYGAAFISMAVQIEGLVGSQGVAPLQPYLEAMRQQHGWLSLYWMPNLFWISSEDWLLQLVPWLGAGCSLLLLLNLYPRLCLYLNYLFYLSLVHAGQIFTRYQWDIMLLEVGVLAIVLSHWRLLGVWLCRWLLFRFMLLCGAVKLIGGDSSWSELTALSFHFETQPLPTAIAWYAHQLPEVLLQLMTILVFVIELGLSLLIFLPRNFRRVAAVGIVVLQLVIILTGNYNFFNFLVLLLCLFLLDDRWLTSWLPRMYSGDLSSARSGELMKARSGELMSARSGEPMKTRDGELVKTRDDELMKDSQGVGPIQVKWMPVMVAALLVGVSVIHTYSTLQQRYPAQPWLKLVQLTQPFFIANNYGVFAVMTQTRPEIVIEGSSDGLNWQAYRFAYKPGDPERAPDWSIPHQPRLDWQLWFAALKPKPEPWFENLMLGLLSNEVAVLRLLAENPFAVKPPRYIRARLFDYRFSTPEEKAQQGVWWQRTLLREYFPTIRLATKPVYVKPVLFR